MRLATYFKLTLTIIYCLTQVVLLTAQEAKPNILWIVAEDLSPFMGCYEDAFNKGHTPTIDNLAARGVLFTRAFATAPVCSPSRSALITGIMQTTSGTHQHRSSRTTDGQVVPEALRIHLPDGVRTLPELMKEAGYFTFNSGKDDYNFHYDRTDLYDVGNAPDYQAGMNGWQGNRAEHSGSVSKDIWTSRPDKNQPWFGQIQIMGGKAGAKHVRKGELLMDGDVPIPPYFPDAPSHRKAWTEHYNANRGADTNLEDILAQLEADGELENTIVIFFSDHGSNTSLRHKQFCYEGGLHVPLILAGRHPSIKAGTVRQELVSLLDVTATTLGLAGIPLPKYLDGQDLFGNDFKAQKYIIGARDRCDYTIDRIRTVRTENYRYIRNYFPERPLMQAGYRDNRPIVLDMKKWYQEGKLNDYQAEHWFGMRPNEELYDLNVDPHQLTNLAQDSNHKSILKRHRKILKKWEHKSDDKGRHPESSVQLSATYNLWKDRPVFRDAKHNPEYDQFKKQ